MAETAAQYNAKIINEFRANGGRVGGMWEETPLLLLHHTGANSGVAASTRSPTCPMDRVTSSGPRTEERRDPPGTTT